MPSLGITGGVATGKSSFTRALLKYLKAVVFDADQCARDLLMHDPQVQEEVLRHFGDGVETHGAIDRRKLREIVFSDSGKRRALEQILHPRIRECWVPQAGRAAKSGEWMVADIPLLYETGAEPYFKAVFVVACSYSTQIARMIADRNLDREIAEKIIASQLDLKIKMQKGSMVVWNDSAPECLDEQAVLIASSLHD